VKNTPSSCVASAFLLSLDQPHFDEPNYFTMLLESLFREAAEGDHEVVL